MKKTVGIIGGMGPAATVDLFNKIVSNTVANKDQDHIHILIDCNPEIPDRTNAILHNGISPLPKLIESAKKLELSGADFLVIPCNTSHYYIENIRNELNIPVISMIEETAKTVLLNSKRVALVLATDGTIKMNIYSSVFENRGIQTIYPDEKHQKIVTNIIYDGIKAGKPTFQIGELNKWILDTEKSFHAVSILACTELPIAVRQYGLTGNFIDPTLALAKAVINYAGYSVK